MINFIKENIFLSILILSIVILILVFLYLLLFKKKDKRKKLVLDVAFFNNILEAIGIDNINTITNNNDRIIVDVKNVSLVKSNFFVEQKLGAFVTKNELKFILKDNSKEFVNHVKGLLK